VNRGFQGFRDPPDTEIFAYIQVILEECFRLDTPFEELSEQGLT